MARSWRAVVSHPVSARLRWAAYAVATAAFVAVLVFRGGPNPAETDAHAVTEPAMDISHGDLRLAEQQTYVPNPPGYPLLTAPFVLALRPWVGAPRWCDDKPIPAILEGQGAAWFRSILRPCQDQRLAPRSERLPLWYRSQAILVVLAWMVLGAGAVLLLGASGAGGGVGEVLLVGALVALPGTTDAIAQSFHPQDLMCVGFSCAALSQALRRRWFTVGVLFGVALLCKQFATLPLLAVLAAAPGWRARVRLVLPAAGVVTAGVLPFYLVDPVDTTRALTAVFVENVTVVKTPTVVGLLGVWEQTKLEIARDAPLVLAAGLALWARWRARGRLLEPVPLIGLALACLAARLVFEISLLDYYFLAVGAFLILVDFCRRRPPLWSAAWIVGTRYVLAPLAKDIPPPVTAGLFLATSLVAIGVGLAQVPGVVGPRAPEPPRSTPEGDGAPTPAAPAGDPLWVGHGVDPGAVREEVGAATGRARER